MKMTADEDAVYMQAFGKSAGKTVKDRMADADAALKQFRAGGMERAVNNGIKDGTLSERAKSRREKINEAIDG